MNEGQLDPDGIAMTPASPSAPAPGGNRWTRAMPILAWLPRYDRAWLAADILAGLTLWGIVVPEGMAYAGIANLPPQAGLYTLVASLLIYALFGSSRHLSVQATSASAALIAGTLATMAIASEDIASYWSHASALVLVVGVLFVIAAVARLGWVTQFLSKPVMGGFVTGLAIFVAVGQLYKLFGVEKVSGNTVEKFFGVVRELPETNWPTLAIGLAALALLTVLPRISPRLPAGLVVLFGSIAVSAALDLHAKYGVHVVGVLPQGLPLPMLPQVPLTSWLALQLPAIGIVLVAYSQALGVAREFAEKHHYEVDPDQELAAHGLANLASALLGGMIAAGGMSASAVKEGAGARSQVSGLVAWVVTLLTLLFLTPLFTNLPEAVLAALIIHALWHLITARKLKQVRLVSPAEFWLGTVTLAGVLFIDVLQGMLLGMLFSLLLVVYRTTRPHVTALGRVPGVPGAYTDLERHPENEPVPDVLILRLDADIYYANALTVRDRILALLWATQPPPRAVVVDAFGQDDLDLTGAEMLKGLVTELHSRGLGLYFVGVHTPVLVFARRVGLDTLIGEENMFPTIDAAVEHIQRAT
jgi:high affinity sulfate transporter 1